MFNETEGGFICGSLSNTLYAFDISSETFEDVGTMPKPRYRHSAVYIAGADTGKQDQLWLIGGRDIDDNLIPDVDVSYNVQNRTAQSAKASSLYSDNFVEAFVLFNVQSWSHASPAV